MANEATLQFDEAVVIWDLGGPDELVIGTSAIPTKDGSVARFSEEFWRPTYDQWGNTAVGLVKVGEEAEATVNIAGFNLQLFADLYPAADMVVDGTDNTKKVVRFGGKIGEDLAAYAKTLTFRRKTLFDAEDPDLGDASQDVTILKAVPRADMEISFAPQTERVYPTVFEGMVDRTLGKVVAFGDNSADPDSGGG